MGEVGVGKDGQPRVGVDRALQAASGLHNEGKSSEAERLYQAILAEAPSHHDALFRLGLLRARAEQMDDAIDLEGARLLLGRHASVRRQHAGLSVHLVLLDRAGAALGGVEIFAIRRWPDAVDEARRAGLRPRPLARS